MLVLLYQVIISAPLDLVTIITDEADMVYANKRIANLIALEALNDYVKGHVNNVKISL